MRILAWDVDAAGTPVGCCLQITGYPTSIASLAFNHQGNLLAVASSYCFEYGEQQNTPPDQIFIRPVVEAEVRPKPRKVAA
jgi:cell cycle arrest protein BUB3